MLSELAYVCTHTADVRLQRIGMLAISWLAGWLAGCLPAPAERVWAWGSAAFTAHACMLCAGVLAGVHVYGAGAPAGEHGRPEGTRSGEDNEVDHDKN